MLILLSKGTKSILSCDEFDTICIFYGYSYGLILGRSGIFPYSKEPNG